MLAMRRLQAIITNHQDRTNMAILPAYEGMRSSLCPDSAKISKGESIPAFAEKIYGKDYIWNRHRLRRQKSVPKVKRFSTRQHRKVSIRQTPV